MKMVKAVTEKDLHLEGVEVSLQQVDGKIEAITITDKNGKYIRIVKDGAYSDNLKVLIEEPKQYTTIYKLIVDIGGDGVSIFKLDSKEKLDKKIDSLDINPKYYSIEEVEVEVQKDLNGREVDSNLDTIF